MQDRTPAACRLLLLLCVLISSVQGNPVSSPHNFLCHRSAFKVAWMSATRGFAQCTQMNNGQLFETYDSGKSWKPVKVDSCRSLRCIRSVFPFADYQHALVQTTSGTVEWEEDTDSASGGRTFVSTHDGSKLGLHKVIPHPQPEHRGRAIGLEYLSNCRSRGCPSHVYITEDFGKTFNLLQLDYRNKGVYRASWGSPYAIPFHPHEVFLVVGMGGSAYSDTSDFKQVESYNVETKEVREVIADSYVFLVVGKFTYYLVDSNKKVSLHVSSDNGEHTKQAIFPSKLVENQYTVIGTSHGAAFVTVYHAPCETDRQVAWATLYQSDTTGENFIVSLPNIRWSQLSRGPDFHSIAALGGVYIANTAQVSTDECRSCMTEKDCTAKCNFVSQISLENGDPRSWGNVKAPQELAEECPDKSNCYLHLHDMASDQPWIPEILSRASTPGMVMGAGNIGSALDTSGDDVSIFLSRDGGMEWKRVLKGPHVFDWTNYGGLIVAVQSHSPTNVMKYSFDFGANWKHAEFSSSSNIYVDKVQAVGGARHADTQGTTFLVFGSYVNSDKAAGTTRGQAVVHSVSLEGDKPTDCILPVGGDPKQGSQFQLFRPHESQDDCFLGQRKDFLQRKDDVICWNGESEAVMETQFHKIKKCACRKWDYECDVGFKWSNRSAVCMSRTTKARVWDSNKNNFVDSEDSHAPRFCNGKTYQRTKGYQLKPGVFCDPKAPGGLDLMHATVDCPPEKQIGGGGPGAFGVFMIVLLVLVVIAITAIYVGAHLFENATAIALKIIIEDVLACCLGSCLNFAQSFMQEKYPPQPLGTVEIESNDEVDDDRDEVEAVDPVSRGAPINAVAAAPVVVPQAAPTAVAEKAPDADDDDFAALAAGGQGEDQEGPGQKPTEGSGVNDLF